MTLDTVEFETAPSPAASLVVLHGLGADGHDFVPICEQLGLSSVGPLRFVFPHAPERPVTINGGWRMRAWYDILGTEAAGREDEAGLLASVAAVTALLEREESRGVPAGRIVLMGFSQGCAMTLAAGLRYPRRLAGLAGLSGYLPLARSLATERAAANADVPVFLAHGRHDSVVPAARGVAARDRLVTDGWPVTWHEYPIDHSVCVEELDDLGAWLRSAWDAR